jgi:endoribonuclease LACTB2
VSHDGDPPSLYEEVLRSFQAGGAPVPAPRRPRSSAAVVPWRRSTGGELEVYWVRRSQELPFMGGWYAFPGGGLSRRDVGVRVEGLPEGLEDPTAVSGLPAAFRPEEDDQVPDLVPGLLACALRELFEETGLLLVRELLPGRSTGPVLAADRVEAAREKLLAERPPLSEVTAALDVTLDAAPLVFAGRWMTPPLAPLRFDNRFFLLHWPAEAAFQPRVIPGELASGEWIRPEVAYRRWRRGEVMAAPPILHLLKVLADDGPQEGLPRLREPREADLGPYRRVEFRPGVVMLPLATATLPPATHTNAYLLGHGEAVLVDPGTRDPQETERLLAALEAFRTPSEGASLRAGQGGRPGQPIRAIWLTHHHPDHVGAVEATRRFLNVPVLAHRATAERLPGIELDGELTDGQEVELAGVDGGPSMRVRVLHTPGHTRGHLCFYDVEGRSLLAGDMVAGVSTIVIDPPEGDMDDYLASLEKLAALDPALVFPGHGPPISRGRAYLEGYVAHRLEREAKILTAWEDGVRDPREMLPRVYDDAPRAAWPLALRQIEAHLVRLRRSGKL